MNKPDKTALNTPNQLDPSYSVWQTYGAWYVAKILKGPDTGLYYAERPFAPTNTIQLTFKHLTDLVRNITRNSTDAAARQGWTVMAPSQVPPTRTPSAKRQNEARALRRALINELLDKYRATHQQLS